MHVQPVASRVGSSTQVAADLYSNVNKVVKGKRAEIRLAIAAILGGGHLLIEDVPGVGKTLLAKALAASIGGTFRRIQGTPDLLPTDLSGVSIYKRSTESWEFRPGPLFANVVLVDEVNRATPRTQSALLEAMEERQVTIDGATHALPDPFFVIATQNPFEHAGTFPLVEGQRDRFAAVMELGLPPREAERQLLLGSGGAAHLRDLDAVVRLEELHAAIADTAAIHCEESIVDYVLSILAATRSHQDIEVGASPRAGISLLGLARGFAAAQGRSYVTPDDVKAVAGPALAHRISLPGTQNLAAAHVIMDGVLATTPAP